MNFDDKKAGRRVRYSPRSYAVREISLNYEGRSEKISARPPDISARGMFINTTKEFPEGAILNVAFRLLRSGVEVHARCEVRYCLPGVGVGVEFVAIPPEDVELINREVLAGRRKRPKSRPRRKVVRRPK